MNISHSSYNGMPESDISQPLLDATMQKNLLKAAGWAKFLSITGLVLLAYLFILLFVEISIFFRKGNTESVNPDPDVIYSNAYDDSMLMFFVFLTVLGISITGPLIVFLFRFANHTQKALKQKQYILLQESFAQLRNYFSLYGIASLVLFVFFVLFSLVALFTFLVVTIKIPV